MAIAVITKRTVREKPWHVGPSEFTWKINGSGDPISFGSNAVLQLDEFAVTILRENNEYFLYILGLPQEEDVQLMLLDGEYTLEVVGSARTYGFIAVTPPSQKTKVA